MVHEQSDEEQDLTAPRFVIKPASWCRHEFRRCPEKCPLSAAEARLREAHRRWHDCLLSYQDAEDFRDTLNSAIQALRNVTFMLQAAKAQLPGFNDWYAAEQEAMRADPVLRWLVDARNMIVKQKDLETRSWLRVRLVTGYDDEAIEEEREQRTWEELLRGDPARITESVSHAPVETTFEAVLDRLLGLDLPMRVRQEATVVLERRWVVDTIPNYELLSLLAHAYGRLHSIISRAHELLGLQLVRVAVPLTPDAEVPSDRRVLKELPMDGRLPCMGSSREQRSSRFRLVDRTEVDEFANWDPGAGPVDPGLRDRLRATYGEMPPIPRSKLGDAQSTKEIETLAQWYANLATAILRTGQDHGWFTFYLREGTVVGSRVHMATDAQGKQAISSEIARAAVELEADAVVVTSEVWWSPLSRTPDGAYLPPSMHAARREAVLVQALAKSGVEANITIPFSVVGGEPPNRKVIIDESMENAVTEVGLLLPTMRAWGIQRLRKRGDAFFKGSRHR